MHNQSDFGYSTGAVSMTCAACGAHTLHCCTGDGVRFTHKIVSEDGFVAGFYSAEDAAEGLHSLRTDRETAHNSYEVLEVAAQPSLVPDAGPC
jgi:hypothetical protein